MTKIPVKMFITDEIEAGFVDLVASYSGVSFTVVRIEKHLLDDKFTALRFEDRGGDFRPKPKPDVLVT